MEEKGSVQAGLQELMGTWECDVPLGLRCLAAALSLPGCSADGFAPSHLASLRSLPAQDALQVCYTSEPQTLRSQLPHLQLQSFEIA